MCTDMCALLRCLQVSLLQTLGVQASDDEVQTFLWRLWQQKGDHQDCITMQVSLHCSLEGCGHGMQPMHCPLL